MFEYIKYNNATFHDYGIYKTNTTYNNQLLLVVHW